MSAKTRSVKPKTVKQKSVSQYLQQWLMPGLTIMLLVTVALALANRTFAATASGGGCASYVTHSATGNKVRACISQGASTNIYGDAYITLKSGVSVYSATFTVMVYNVSSSGAIIEKRGQETADVKSVLNNPPLNLRNYDRTAVGFVSSGAGKYYKTVATLCTKKTSGAAKVCTTSTSPLQKAGS